MKVDRNTLFFGGCLFLMGVTLGFLLSPVKGGFGNHSGNTTNHVTNNYFGDTDDEVALEEALEDEA